MTGTVPPKGKDVTEKFNRILYTGFVILAMYFLIFSGDVSQAMANLGIALIFDPFDQKQKFTERPFYQKAWLFIHLTLVLVLLGLTLTGY
jgi:hypothetical protein